MRSAGGRLSSKKQNGHWSEEGRGDADSEGGDGFMVLVSSLSRCVMVSWAVSSTLLEELGSEARILESVVGES